jgi:hypothetical protein
MSSGAQNMQYWIDSLKKIRQGDKSMKSKVRVMKKGASKSTLKSKISKKKKKSVSKRKKR